MHVLDLSHNRIENIVHGCFEDSSITSINLSNNKLTNLQVGQLNVPSVERLILSHNTINFFAPGCFHPNLKYLNLEDCYISDLNVDIFNNTIDLQTLILSNNKLKTVPEIPGLQSSLEYLDLSHNEITDIAPNAISSLYGLRTLDLSYNKLRTIHAEDFADIALEKLYLHWNILVNIDPNVPDRVLYLREFSFAGNPWPCPCLQQIERFVEMRNITQPPCDIKYFKQSNLPICMDYGDSRCIGREQLNSAEYVRFLRATRRFSC